LTLAVTFDDHKEALRLLEDPFYCWKLSEHIYNNPEICQIDAQKVFKAEEPPPKLKVVS